MTRHEAQTAVAGDIETDLELMPGEAESYRDRSHRFDDAKHWVAVYRELAAFSERSLGQRDMEADERLSVERRLRHFRTRIAFWARFSTR
jgi:hypothetical protein